MKIGLHRIIHAGMCYRGRALTVEELFDQEIASESLKCSLDCGLLIDQSDEGVETAVKDTGDLQVISHFFGEFERDANGKVALAEIRGPDWPTINYPAFVRALRRTGFKGYLDFEFCHAALDERHNMAGTERVHDQTALAAEYMRTLIEQG